DDGFKPYQQSTGSIKPLPLPDATSLRWQAEDELLSAEESADAGTLQQWQASSRAIVGSHACAERAVAPDVLFYLVAKPALVNCAFTLILVPKWCSAFRCLGKQNWSIKSEACARVYLN